VAAIFRQVDPQLHEYFSLMQYERLLDLENRKGKATGGYCTEFAASRRAFIFMNATGIHEDVQTLLHEGGHAFHAFECAHLPYFRQKEYPMEFAEVASTSMELLGAPYLSMPGGFYLPADAARARINFLTEAIWFWPYMAVVDAFQHWVYLHPTEAADPAACDDAWGRLWERYMRGQDWSGLEDAMCTGWQRKPHIPTSPFYYVEYGLASLGSFQVWRNSLRDPQGAVKAYRRALALGGTASLPDLFRAAGARLAFDAETLQETVDLAMKAIEEMEGIRA
jgi:oligoendopeptidase F